MATTELDEYLRFLSTEQVRQRRYRKKEQRASKGREKMKARALTQRSDDEGDDKWDENEKDSNS